MTFEEFKKNCSFDFEYRGNMTEIVVIFSSGFLKDYPSEFVRDNEELSKDLVASDLFNYLNKEFNDGQYNS